VLQTLGSRVLQAMGRGRSWERLGAFIGLMERGYIHTQNPW
jgi:hypothetical protein